jgi:hypothetical protein
MADQDSGFKEIDSRLKSIELRLSKLESELLITKNENSNRLEEQFQPVDSILNRDITIEEDKGFESKIGQFGLAWLGNIVLLFGIIFLSQYLMNLGFRVLSALLGYILAASIFFLSDYLKKTNVHLSFMFKMNAQILLFYITLRLHFFSTTPLLINKTISLFSLLLLVGF